MTSNKNSATEQTVQNFDKNGVVCLRISNQRSFDQASQSGGTKAGRVCNEKLESNSCSPESGKIIKIENAASTAKDLDDCVSSKSVSSSCSYKSIKPRAERERQIAQDLEPFEMSGSGSCLTVQLKKGTKGFGFTIVGRTTTRGKLILCVGWVHPDGQTFGILKAGDQITEVNHAPVIDMKHEDVTDQLKRIKVGSIVTLGIIPAVKVNATLNNSTTHITHVEESEDAEAKEADVSVEDGPNPFERNSDVRRSRKSFDPPAQTQEIISPKPSYRKNPRLIVQNFVKSFGHTGFRSAKALAEATKSLTRSHSISPTRTRKDQARKEESEATPHWQQTEPNYLNRKCKSLDALQTKANKTKTDKLKSKKTTVKRYSPERKTKSLRFNLTQRFSSTTESQMRQIVQWENSLKMRMRFTEGQKPNPSTARFHSECACKQQQYLQNCHSGKLMSQPNSRPTPSTLSRFDLSRYPNNSSRAPSYHSFVERNVGHSYYQDYQDYHYQKHYFSQF
ncbi:unnamed protein product, partial [Mesorhabditis belari]|uniref:PDZ domain-containing protein n=1 Tax=Mesorhabditis belari TaxID=2138241 RepID=A0AAF3J7H6_9BILA